MSIRLIQAIQGEYFGAAGMEGSPQGLLHTT